MLPKGTGEEGTNRRRAVEKHGEYLSANIGPYCLGRGAEERVDAPLIDLHKIAVSWLRLLALRADRQAAGQAKRRKEARSLPI